MRGKYAKKRTRAETAIVPGSFDPVTKGHMLLIDYAARHYRKVYAVIFVNPDKRYEFSLNERMKLLAAACAGYQNVTVDHCEGMQYLYAKEKGIGVSVRGYRNEKDLAYEHEMAEFNEKSLPGYRTELLRCPDELCAISSTEVRRRLAAGEDISSLVPKETLGILSKMR